MTTATRLAGLTDLRQRLDATGQEAYSAVEDAIHGGVLDAVSQTVSAWCGDQFYLTAAGTVRYLTAEWADVLVVPSLTSIDTGGLVTDDNGTGTYGTTWATTDYILQPDNAAAEDPARPYTEVRVDWRTTSAGLTFPTGQRGVRITGRWGWPEVPATVREVVILEALRMLAQMQAPSGVAASAELGQWLVMPDIHPTSRMMLQPYRRMGARVAVGR
jgi:hypothetical protein